MEECSQSFWDDPLVLTTGESGDSLDWDPLDWEERDEEIPFLRHALAGSVAGVAEHVGIYPLDTVKTRMQANASATGICKTIADVVHEPRRTIPGAKRGLGGLYRGATAIGFGCIPAHIGLFGTYEFVKGRLVEQEGYSTIGPAVAGMCGSVVHDAVITPCDVVKQRLQLGAYRSSMHCVASIWEKEGLVALYRSLPITLFINVPYTGTLVTVNEWLKHRFNITAECNILYFFFCAGVSGAAAAVVTLPLDVVKTQIQTGALLQVEGHGMGVIATSNRIWQLHGVSGFTRGLLPRVFIAAPSAAICWGTYETVKQALGKLATYEAALVAGGVDPDSDPLEWEEWDPYDVPFWKHAVAGSMAGIMEHVAMYPVDTVKTRMQAAPTSLTSVRLGALDTASHVIRTDGFFGLFRGMPSSKAAPLSVGLQVAWLSV